MDDGMNDGMDDGRRDDTTDDGQGSTGRRRQRRMVKTEVRVTAGTGLVSEAAERFFL